MNIHSTTIKDIISKILWTLGSAFLVYQSIGLITNIHSANIQTIYGNLFVAWIINMFITGIFAFLVFAYPIEKVLPTSYYHIHHPNRLKSFGKTIGLHLFRKFLLATFWRNKKQQKKYFDGKKSGLQNLNTQSQKSEFGHILPFIIIVSVSIYLLVLGLYQLAIFTMFFNILGNFYPVILQRNHRFRIAKILARK